MPKDTFQRKTRALKLPWNCTVTWPSSLLSSRMLSVFMNLWGLYMNEVSSDIDLYILSSYHLLRIIVAVSSYPNPDPNPNTKTYRITSFILRNHARNAATPLQTNIPNYSISQPSAYGRIPKPDPSKCEFGARNRLQSPPEYISSFPSQKTAIHIHEDWDERGLLTS